MGFRLIYSLLLGIVIIVALALRLIDPSPVARMRSLVFDTYQVIKPRVYDPSVPVRIIDIDEESLARLGQWPWPRTILADLVKKLHDQGAATIAFDMIFPEPDRLSPANTVKSWPDSPATAGIKAEASNLPSNDAVFADAMKGAPVVLGFVGVDVGGRKPLVKTGFAHAGDDPMQFVPGFRSAATSLPELEGMTAGLGTLNWIAEHDQVTRRLPMLVRVGDELHPSFILEALRVAQGATTMLVKSSGASGEESFGQKSGVVSVKVGEFEAPTAANGELWVRFSPATRDRYVPAWRVLAGEIPKADIEGRIFLIGTSAAGLNDLRATPLDAAMPGIEVHAQAIEQIIRGAFLHRPDFAAMAELAFILVLGLVIALLVYFAGAIVSAVLIAIAIVGVIVASWLAFDRWNWLVDPIYPSISLLAFYLVGTVSVFLRTEGERNRVRSAFGHYMAPALVEKLANDPSKLKLGGETRDMTLLFSDVRDFTSIAEGLDAEALTSFINSLFTPLSEIILDEKGTIDKYMGDSVMAFWNAPLDDPDHAENACRAALRMAGEMEALNAQWRDQAATAGRPYRPVKIGIGLNTGEVCVGNLGSERRFDYSVIGDNVNVASRLEGQCKVYNVPIITGEPTASRASSFAFIEIDLVKVKGRKTVTRVFTLIGDPEIKRSLSFGGLLARHTEMLASFRGRDWDRAEKLTHDCEILDGGRLDGVYALYRARIATYRKRPPPKSWDGSSEARAK